MTQKDKKPKGKRTNTKANVGHKTGTILEIIKHEYIARILCWCGQELIIDSSKPIEENVCSQCNSPYKLVDWEWTPEEQNKLMKKRGMI